MKLTTAAAIVTTSLSTITHAGVDPFAGLSVPQPVVPPTVAPVRLNPTPQALPPLPVLDSTIETAGKHRGVGAPLLSSGQPAFNLEAEIRSPIIGMNVEPTSSFKLKPLSPKDWYEAKPLMHETYPVPDRGTSQSPPPFSRSVQPVNLAFGGAVASGIGAYLGWKAVDGIVSQIERDNPELEWAQCQAKAALGLLGGKLGCRAPEPLPMFPTSDDISNFEWQRQSYLACHNGEHRQFNARSRKCDEALALSREELRTEESEEPRATERSSESSSTRP